ncbi:hypothetical protein B0H13DRAFT_2310222 [Mycena leptocephala]|nr:hypothetical protein B0H13DRAFT_2310222 [Mycena leptocephala]
MRFLGVGFRAPDHFDASKKFVGSLRGLPNRQGIDTSSTLNTIRSSIIHLAYINSTDLIPRAGTEVVSCYNSGTKADRAPIVSVIEDWCGRVIGSTVVNGQLVWACYNCGTFTVYVSGQAINGCNFVIDGNCNRLLRLPVDGCNTGGVNRKQGGFETDICGQGRTDPGSSGSDF